MSGAAASRATPHCHHCGRPVSETVHTRIDYRVDYYTLHTGDAEPVTLARADDAVPPVTVWRLLRGVEIVTCADCYRRPAVRRERETLFRPEVAVGEATPAAAEQGEA